MTRRTGLKHYDPLGREAYLEKTRYTNNSQEDDPGETVFGGGAGILFLAVAPSPRRSTDATSPNSSETSNPRG